MSNRTYFGSKLGVILATAGSAVGLGNIWRFPFMTGHNGGAAFILLYLGCVFLLGIPGMIAEFIVGRHGGSNAARAYRKVGGRLPWGFTGYLGVFTSMVILGFYAVVAGWCLQYLFASFAGSLKGDAGYVTDYFRSFSSHPWKPALWAIAFVGLTHFVVAKGVKDGIEKASEVMLEALGQAFFSLSLGTACLCTYSSYFSRKIRLARSATQIALMDSGIAILAGLMIFPAAFAVGVSPDSGPSLIFITLPNVFQQAFSSVPIVGYIISILFYFLLALAALTSTISMHEIGTAFFHEELHVSRQAGAWVVTVACGVLAVLCSLSMGAVPSLQVMGNNLLDACDKLTAQYLLPIGSLLTCLMVGWYLPKKLVHDQLTNWGTLRGNFYHVFLFLVRFVCPLGIIAIFLRQLGII